MGTNVHRIQCKYGLLLMFESVRHYCRGHFFFVWLFVDGWHRLPFALFMLQADLLPIIVTAPVSKVHGTCFDLPFSIGLHLYVGV